MKLVNAHIADLESCDDLNMRQFLMKYIIPLDIIRNTTPPVILPSALSVKQYLKN